jgi:chemotaxis family two-component system sensor histidine kinase/response regulator PixL
LSIDLEVEALLFEGYECLRLPLTAELTGGQVNDTEILDRTAAVFAQLQDKLGDCFGQEAHIPSSIELGFDVTQSIFEVGVTQRLEEIATVVASADPAGVATTLRTQSEVFLGLAESLGLPGFGAIAQAAIAALDTHPEQVVTIAQTALADFQAGQAAILNGDRIQGGQPSLTLQQLAGFTTSSTELTQGEGGEGERGRGGEFLLYFPATPAPNNTPGLHPATLSTQEESATEPELNWVTSAANSESSVSEAHNEESDDSLLEVIWGGEAVVDSQTSEQGQEIRGREDRENAASYSPHHFIPSSQEPEVTVETPLSRHQRTNSEPTPIPQKEASSQSATVRVNVEHLNHLNYSIGELLTNQNLQSLQNEQLQTSVRVLLARIKQHQQLLNELQDWSDRLFVDAEQRRIGNWGLGTRGWGLGTNNPLIPNHPSLIPEQSDRFDSLELDRYNEAQLLVQSILEDAVQLAEASEAIELFGTQSTQTLDKQRRLLTSTRDALMEARMLPLGEIFGRFPRVLQQLEALHDKLVALELRGTEVLVDKVVAEKLYGPLLHLIRNAFDHGIEPPAIRQQLGKAQKGQIEIQCLPSRQVLGD